MIHDRRVPIFIAIVVGFATAMMGALFVLVINYSRLDWAVAMAALIGGVSGWVSTLDPHPDSYNSLDWWFLYFIWTIGCVAGVMQFGATLPVPIAYVVLILAFRWLGGWRPIIPFLKPKLYPG